jgi:hypothetical protein
LIIDDFLLGAAAVVRQSLGTASMSTASTVAGTIADDDYC